MKGRAIRYSQEELSWIEANKEKPRKEAHKEFCAKFSREDVKLTNYNSLCKRKGWLTGRTGQYPKGSIPMNKGKKMPFNANRARTQFKKGQLPHNTKFLGHERTTEDGYVEISINETNPHTGYERRYVLKHKWLWEQENGPVPEGHCLKCLDGNRQNTSPDNWEVIPRGLLPRLGAFRGRDFDNAPAEMKPTILAVTRLEHKAKQLEKKAAS